MSATAFILDEAECPNAKCGARLFLASGQIPAEAAVRAAAMARMHRRRIVTPGAGVDYKFTCPTCEARIRVAGHGPDYGIAGYF